MTALTTKPPSTEWREKIAPDEDARFADYAARMVAVQQAQTKKAGRTGRALHRKELLGVKGTFEVLGGLPPHAAHGVFATPKTFDAVVRLSNGHLSEQRDRVPDIRGFALKLLGVDGPSALGGPATSQDFLLINREAFALPNSAGFVGLVEAAVNGPPAVVWYFLRTYGLVKGFALVKDAVTSMNKPFTGFATERLTTVASFACGPYAARARLLPASTEVDPRASDDWGADMRRRLAQGPLTYEFQLQFFVDEGATPIEDVSVNWPDAVAPWRTVGKLTLRSEEVAVEQLAFDPWSALAVHRPLGDVMRARKAAYFASQKERGLHQG